MTSDETQIQVFADWAMSHANRVTKDNRKNPEYHLVVAIRRLRTDKNCPAEIAVFGVEPAVKYSFVYSGTQTRLKGQYNAELTLSPRLQVKPLITAIRAITYHI